MTPPEQRRSERYPADWAARYRLDPDADWRACRVIDVSLDGAALELAGTTSFEELTGPLHLEIASVAGDQVGVNVRATIRRSARAESGLAIVGIEFSILRAEERNLLQLLVGLRARP